MTREIVAALMLSIIPLFVLAFYLSVRAKRKRQESTLPKPLQLGEELHEAVTSLKRFACQYVATTYSDSRIERLWAWGLGARGKATAAVSDSVQITRVGEVSFAIPIGAIESLGRARATIDRGVEPEGLVVIVWNLGEQRLATHLRFVSAADQQEFESQLNLKIGEKIG